MSKIINPKINRAERPDKAAFRAFMGAFFLLACIAPAYWAYYNYGQYQQTIAFVRKLQENSEQFLTNDERAERKNRIALNTSMANRYRLEIILSGAGSLILFGGAIFLFTLAVKARKNKPQYANIDWQTIPLPTRRIEVQYKRFYNVLFAFIIIFCGGADAACASN